MREFEYDFLYKGEVPASLVNTIYNIASLKARADIKKREHARMLKELESSSRMASVKASNEISALVTDDARMREIVIQSSSPLSDEEAEIAGYRDALLEISTKHDKLNFKQSDILSIHKKLYYYTGKPHGGNYETAAAGDTDTMRKAGAASGADSSGDNMPISIRKINGGKPEMRSLPDAELEGTMRRLANACTYSFKNNNINKLMLIPCIILDFMCISPFKEGNGRMARLLSLMLLYKCGFDAPKYISFEEKLLIRKVFYDISRKQSAIDWYEVKNNYYPFMDNFLTSLHMCYSDLDERFDSFDGKKINKSTRIETAVLESKQAISKAEICSLLPDVSPTTVEAVLGKMVKSGKILKIGKSRACRYIKN